jgi:hypothetical protein
MNIRNRFKNHNAMVTSNNSRKMRYAVVGLGWISQAAMLPAFQNARHNSELVALVSSDSTKLKTLSETYGIRLHRTSQPSAQGLHNPSGSRRNSCLL